MIKTSLYKLKSSITNSNWNIIDLNNESKRYSDYLYQKYELPYIIAPYLFFKGIDLNNFEHFLMPKLKNLLPEPFLFKDMEKGVKRLVKEVENSSPIGIFGDYDVDGATSAAMISSYLESCGCKTFIHIPDRFLEGYGPNKKALKSLNDKGAKLIITVDCGISSFEPLKAMKEVNLDLIVIDHHNPDKNLPPAYAIINPKRSDNPIGYENLCAAGVTFIFLIALNRELRNRGFFHNIQEPDLFYFLDLVALGTVCDVVPLNNLNRALVKQGLKVMKKRKNVGLRVLSDISNLNDQPNCQSLGYSLGPRINAGGRIGNSELGVHLLKETSEVKSIEIASKLDILNKKRKYLTSELEKKVIGKIEQLIIENEKKIPNAIILDGEDYHEGITGIVAGRMKELYNRPICIISVSSEGIGKGSGRSIHGIALGKIILKALESKLIVSGGGHDMAVGFTINSKKIKLFSDFLINSVNTLMQKGFPPFSYLATSIIPISACNSELTNWLDILSPWGSGIEEPKFIITNAKISSLRRFGANNEHVSFYISDGTSKKLLVKKFNVTNNILNKVFKNYENINFDFLGSLTIDTWNNSKTIEFMLDDIYYSTIS